MRKINRERAILGVGRVALWWCERFVVARSSLPSSWSSKDCHVHMTSDMYDRQALNIIGSQLLHQWFSCAMVCQSRWRIFQWLVFNHCLHYFGSSILTKVLTLEPNICLGILHRCKVKWTCWLLNYFLFIKSHKACVVADSEHFWQLFSLLDVQTSFTSFSRVPTKSYKLKAIVIPTQLEIFNSHAGALLSAAQPSFSSLLAHHYISSSWSVRVFSAFGLLKRPRLQR